MPTQVHNKQDQQRFAYLLLSILLLCCSVWLTSIGNNRVSRLAIEVVVLGVSMHLLFSVRGVAVT